MTEQMLAPTELNDAELLVVSGGVDEGGGNNITFNQAFTASTSQTATNTNNGSVSAVVGASGSTVAMGIAQSIYQAAAIEQAGGSVGIGG